MTVYETLTKISCGECGGVYAIGERFRQECYQQGKSWTCPYCKCGWGYSNDSENEKLKRENQQLQSRVSRLVQSVEYQTKEAEHFRASRNAIKGVVTKIKRRVKHGVCPCCKRTFGDLARHMTTKHPQFAEETTTP